MTSKTRFKAGSRTRFCVAAGACIALLFTMSATVWATGETEAAAVEEVPIKVFVPGPLRMDPDTDLSINEMERRLNIDLQIVGGPWDQVWSKLNLMMASGDPLDIMHVSNQGQNAWQQWAQEGLIANLDDHVTPEKYPFIHKVMTADMFKPLTIDGAHYYVPGTHHGYDWQFHIRQDWLDNLGLSMPSTPAELYEVLKAFSEGDPDGNGKDDTTGFVTSAATGVGAPIFMAYNASANIKDMEVQDDGTVISLAAHQGTLEALKFGNRLYREGALNTDFINHPNNEESLQRVDLFQSRRRLLCAGRVRHSQPGGAHRGAGGGVRLARSARRGAGLQAQWGRRVVVAAARCLRRLQVHRQVAGGDRVRQQPRGSPTVRGRHRGPATGATWWTGFTTSISSSGRRTTTWKW